MTNVRIGIGGINGHMGQAIRQAASESAGLVVMAGVVRAGSEDSGDEIQITSDPAALSGDVDVFIDVSASEALEANLSAMVAAGVPYVSGVTGLESDQLSLLDQAADSIPVLYAPNFSVGVVVVAQLLETLARSLPDADLEIVETHHRRKKDAPSGTANLFIDAIMAAQDGPATLVHGRSGASLRTPGEIGVHSLRGGGNSGEHRVHFLLDGEEIVVEHRALSRVAFAMGALRAAGWLVHQPPGRYAMQDVVSNSG
jgi:4-hydroxy-tetrahydrodipicolinate reductase